MKKRINLAIVLLVLVLVGAGRALANAAPLATGPRLGAGAPDGRLAHIDCPSDPYEENGSFGAARMIEVGGALWAYICPEEDDDWYKFGVTSGQEITVDLTNLPADFDLALYDPSGGFVAESANAGENPEHIEHTASMTGDYRVLVYGYSGAASTEAYRLAVALSGGPTDTPTQTPTPTDTPTATPTETPTETPSCPFDMYEGDHGNDLWGTAYGPIDPGSAYCGGYVCPLGDQDWYKFGVSDGQQITVDLYDLPANFDLRLFDPAQGLQGVSNSSDTTPEQIVHTASTSGEYRIVVYGHLYEIYSDSDDYCLQVTLDDGPTATPTPTGTRTTTVTPTGTRTTTCTPTATSTLTTTIPCPTDDYEDNDGWWMRYGPIDPGVAYHAYICPAFDEDWFAFSVTVGQQFTVTLDSLPANFDLHVLDLWRNEVGNSVSSGTTAEQVVHTATVTGDYLVNVCGRGAAYSTEGTYCLTVTLGAEPPAGEGLFLPLVLKNWP